MTNCRSDRDDIHIFKKKKLTTLEFMNLSLEGNIDSKGSQSRKNDQWTTLPSNMLMGKVKRLRSISDQDRIQEFGVTDDNCSSQQQSAAWDLSELGSGVSAMES